MNPPSQDIAAIIEDATLATLGTTLFVSREPQDPDECITIYDTGGLKPDHNRTYDKPTVQVRIRGKMNGYLAAYAMAESIKTLLHGKHNEVWNGTRYIMIVAQSDIMNLGYDPNGRPLLTINFIIHRTA